MLSNGLKKKKYPLNVFIVVGWEFSAFHKCISKYTKTVVILNMFKNGKIEFLRTKKSVNLETLFIFNMEM